MMAGILELWKAWIVFADLCMRDYIMVTSSHGVPTSSLSGREAGVGNKGTSLGRPLNCFQVSFPVCKWCDFKPPVGSSL